MKFDILNKFENKITNTESPVFSVLLILVGFLLLHPSLFYFGVHYDVDSSWVVAISEVVNKKLLFGKEVIYPYGPLGYLIARGINLPSVINCVLFDLFLICNFIYALYYFIVVEKKNKLLVSIIFFVSCLIIGSLNGPRNNFVLLFFELFYIFLFLTHRKISYLLLAISLGVLIFFIKANLGIISIFLVLFLLTHQLIVKKVTVLKSMSFS